LVRAEELDVSKKLLVNEFLYRLAARNGFSRSGTLRASG
jgi:hypothetical protein